MHEHEHEHAHIYEQEHTHEHASDHAHTHDHEAVPFLDIDEHEDALVATLRIRIPGTYERGENALEDALRRTAEGIEEAGGLVGHIKAYVREEGRACMISVTAADDLQRKELKKHCVYAEVAAIVFGIEKQELEHILQCVWGGWLQ